MSTYSAQADEAEASQLHNAAYNSAAGLITTLAPHQAPAIGPNSFSPSLDLLTHHGLQVPLAQGSQQQSSQGSAGGLAFGARLSATPFSTSVSDAARKAAPPGEKQLCTFFLRTGTCAYGDRCKFAHPLDRPPPTLNSRGYPVRAEEPDCAHYLKKGWCAFGPTCKFNHPEMQPSILNSYSISQPPTAYVSLPTTTFPSATVYSVPSAMPTLYYLPPGVTHSQLGGATVSLLPSTVGAVAPTQASQLAFSQQGALASAAQAPLYRQPAPSAPYGALGAGGIGASGIAAGGMTAGGMAAGGMGSSVTALQEAFQGLALARPGGLGRGK